MENKFKSLVDEPIIATAAPDMWGRILELKLDFIEKGIIPEATACLPQEVIDSWALSKKNNVNRHEWPPENVPKDELKAILEDSKLLIDTAKPFISGYSAILEDYNMLLYDNNGVILDFSFVGKDEKISVGGNRGEAVAGTTAHNLAARHKRPVQIIGPVNYCTALESNVTSAAPILNEYGELLGMIVLYQRQASGLWRLGHNLGWITSTAMAISSQLRLYRRDTRLKAMDDTFKTALEHSKDAFISVDNAGHIINYNKEAARLMKVGDSKPKTLFFDMLVDPFPVKKAVKSGIQAYGKPLVFRNNDKALLSANINPFPNGAVIKIPLVQSIKKSKITFSNITHESNVMRNLIDTATLVGRNPVNILLLGESGTGKELFAQAIHNSHSSGPFVAINCASMPANLIESELFGYEKGAFTGADKEGRKGKIEYANGGTLFLDEIGDMPLELQPVLLRVLEEKRVTRVGGHRSVAVDFRIISATNRSLYDDVKNKLFRSDLYFRLSVVNLEIPPLRERGDDAISLAERFIKRICKRFELPPYRLADETKEIIRRYDWPGNVRQLENAMTYAVSFAKNSTITPDNLPREIWAVSDSESDQVLKEIRDMEFDLIEKVVKSSKNMEEAAKQLGLSRSTLYRRLRRIK